MTRNCFVFIAAISFLPTLVLATVDSPIAQGLAGARRSGIPSESLSTNPAAVWFNTTSSAFYFYTKPSIVETNEGGRAFSAGVYDGENPAVKGGFGYVRNSRTRLEGSTRVYDDRTEFRFNGGRPISGEILGGFAGRYVTLRNSGVETKFFQADVGLLFPLMEKMRAGLTYENILEKPGERPPTVGTGIRYAIGSGIELIGDGSRVMRGNHKGAQSWAMAAEISVSNDLFIRGGKYQDVFGQKGWSAGGSWVGPRTSIDYAYRVSQGNPHEQDHVVGMRVQF